MIMRKILPVILMVLLFACLVGASFIRISTTFNKIGDAGVIKRDSTLIDMKVSNTGDEAAHNMQLSLTMPEGFSTNQLFPGMLGVNQTFTGTFEVNVSENVKPGRYPMVLVTHYTDANSYPFSTVSPTYLVFEKPTPILMRGFMPEVSLEGETPAKVKLKVSNTDSKAHDVLIRMHLPNELKASPDSTTIKFAPKETKDVEVGVESFGALPGSNYVVFASLEYDDDMHYSSVISGMIKVVAKEPTFKMPSTTILIIVGVLILLVVAYYQFKK